MPRTLVVPNSSVQFAPNDSQNIKNTASTATTSATVVEDDSQEFPVVSLKFASDKHLNNNNNSINDSSTDEDEDDDDTSNDSPVSPSSTPSCCTPTKMMMNHNNNKNNMKNSSRTITTTMLPTTPTPLLSSPFRRAAPTVTPDKKPPSTPQKLVFVDPEETEEKDIGNSSSIHKTDHKLAEDLGHHLPEPLLVENPRRFVLFPIQDNEVRC